MDKTIDKNLERSFIEHAKDRVVRKGHEALIQNAKPRAIITNPNATPNDIRYSVVWQTHHGKTAKLSKSLKTLSFINSLTILKVLTLFLNFVFIMRMD